MLKSALIKSNSLKKLLLDVYANFLQFNFASVSHQYSWDLVCWVRNIFRRRIIDIALEAH